MNYRSMLVMIFFLSIGVVFAGGGKDNPEILKNPAPLPVPESTVYNFVTNAPPETPAERAQGQPNWAETAPGQVQSRALTVLRAIAEAYPDITGDIKFQDGDWSIQVYGETYYYAESRMLPASLKDRMSEYDPQPFYNYAEELPPWTPPSAEESARMREQDSRRRASRPAKRSPHFYDTLFRTHNRDESWEHVKQINFLGHTVLVHYSILEELSLVEEQILRIAKTNTAVRQWVNNIKSIDGWNWRNIAESESRSFHAYGAAIDFLPNSLGGLQTYWLWTSQHTPEWWAVPYSRRLHPPIEVIKAFESFGFIWGGKWRFYDTMHFEYRPEILVLSGMNRMNLKDLK